MGWIARTFAFLPLFLLLGKIIFVFLVLSIRTNEVVDLVSGLPKLEGSGDVYQLVDKRAVKTILQPWKACQHKYVSLTLDFS